MDQDDVLVCFAVAACCCILDQLRLVSELLIQWNVAVKSWGHKGMDHGGQVILQQYEVQVEKKSLLAAIGI